MKKICLFVICLPLLVFSQFSNQADRYSNKQFKDSVIQEIFILVNQHRVSNHIHELKWCKKLQKSCISHSKYMSYDDYHCHKEINQKNPYYKGDHCWDRTNIKMCGENVLARYEFNGQDAATWLLETKKIRNAKEIALEMFTQWKLSPGHNRNMLRKRWNYMAFDYYAYNTQKSYDKFYATQLFR